MRTKQYFLALNFFLIVLLLLSACSKQETVSQVQTPQQTGPQAAPEPAQPKTEIKASGAGMEMLISPSTGNTVSKVITITMTKTPSGTKAVSFAMEMQGNEPVPLGVDSDGSDGWSLLVDTAQHKNGIYKMGGVAFASLEKGSVPIGVSSAQVVIQN